MLPRNGYWPADLLVEIEPGYFLRATAAAGYFAFRGYAKSKGRTIRPAWPAGAYRSLAVQEDMVEHPERYNLSPDNKTGLATPGYSGHGDANCIDFVGTDLAWIIINARKFGFTRPLGDRDPNHFRHDGVTAIAGSIALVLIPQHTEGDSMPQLYALKGSEPRLRALAGASPGTPANWIEATDDTVASGWLPKNNDGVPVGSFTDLSQQTWDNFKGKYLAPVQVQGTDVAAGDTIRVEALLQAIAGKLDGLPAEIDRYADGRKQAT
jgi:hypothetical protein